MISSRRNHKQEVSREVAKRKAKRSFRNDLPQWKAAGPHFMVRFAKNEHMLQNPEVKVHIHKDGHNLSQKLGDFKECHLFQSTTGLEFVIPDVNFKNMKSYLESVEFVQAIDSSTQKNWEVSIDQFLDAFKVQKKQRDCILNMISLEFSNEESELTRKFETLRFVRENGMVNQLETALAETQGRLEKEMKSAKSEKQKTECDQKLAAIKMILEEMPRYQKFLLVSMAGSFTDIHVDFSATSVYYHVKKGRKIFYVAPPTERNLKIYEAAEKMEFGNRWAGDLLWEQWQRIEIREGQTAMIPAGWIHFVYTPEDSIVVGGNFLLERHLEMQFRMTKLEEECIQLKGKIDRFNMFRGFFPLMWAFLEHVFLPNLSANPLTSSDDSRLKSIRTFLKELDPQQSIENEWFSLKERQEIYNGLKRAWAKVPNTWRMITDDWAMASALADMEPEAKRVRRSRI